MMYFIVIIEIKPSNKFSKLFTIHLWEVNHDLIRKYIIKKTLQHDLLRPSADRGYDSFTIFAYIFYLFIYFTTL